MANEATLLVLSGDAGFQPQATPQKRKRQDITWLGLRAYSVFCSESSSRWFNMFHRKGRISKVMHMTFTIFQEGNLFCRYFLDTNSEEERGFLLMGYTDFISLMGNS